MTRGFFVTGTDTGVGKTLISTALIAELVNRGHRTLGMKPIATGCERRGDGWHCEDSAHLIAAANVPAPFEEVTPYAFEPPIAPHLAAAAVATTIDVALINDVFLRLKARADYVVVEGVGGFLVPLDHARNLADLAVALDLPVIMVVGMRLGCLNHALLTAEAVAARGLYLAGWVANCIDPSMDAFLDNVASLRERLQAPLLGVLPALSPVRLKDAAACLDLKTLLSK